MTKSGRYPAAAADGSGHSASIAKGGMGLRSSNSKGSLDKSTTASSEIESSASASGMLEPVGMSGNPKMVVKSMKAKSRADKALENGQARRSEERRRHSVVESTPFLAGLKKTPRCVLIFSGWRSVDFPLVGRLAFCHSHFVVFGEARGALRQRQRSALAAQASKAYPMSQSGERKKFLSVAERLLRRSVATHVEKTRKEGVDDGHQNGVGQRNENAKNEQKESSGEKPQGVASAAKGIRQAHGFAFAVKSQRQKQRENSKESRSHEWQKTEPRRRAVDGPENRRNLVHRFARRANIERIGNNGANKRRATDREVSPSDCLLSRRPCVMPAGDELHAWLLVNAGREFSNASLWETPLGLTQTAKSGGGQQTCPRELARAEKKSGSRPLLWRFNLPVGLCWPTVKRQRLTGGAGKAALK